MNNIIGILVRGMAMGAADIVPGVSGGTIAFITGIYERLINALKSINLKALKILFQSGIGTAWKHIDGSFLLVLFSGIMISVLTLAKFLQWAMEHYPQMLWAFFFGLIISSALYIGKKIPNWNISVVLALLIGIVVAFSITLIVPAEASTAKWMVFLSGSIAICAMILPGISGSFILLLMGMYAHVLGAVNDRDIFFILIFMAGCLIGLLLFSHLLSWMFKHYHSVSLAVLTGFMIGALNKVWPWQNIISYRTNSHGEEVPFLMKSVLPDAYQGEAMLLAVILMILLGFISVFIIERFAEPETED